MAVNVFSLVQIEPTFSNFSNDNNSKRAHKDVVVMALLLRIRGGCKHAQLSDLTQKQSYID